MSYIPSSVPEISDHIMFMILSCPDDFANEADDIDGVFDALEAGVEKVGATLSNEKYVRIIEMIRRSKGLYLFDKKKEAVALLYGVMDSLKAN